METPRIHPALREAHAAAVAHHGDLGLSEEDLARAARALWERGRERLDLPAEPEAFLAALPRLRLEDLYLAQACDAGNDDAWRRFRELYEQDLAGVLVRDGQSGAEPEQLASSVIADMAMPPPKGRARTLLGTYEGSGPLWAWLAAIGVRRVRKQMKRRPSSLDVQAETPDATLPEPWQSAVETESVEAFRAGVESAWQTLEPRERTALVLRHRDGCTQREVSRVLGLSEPTVSRLVHAAIEKVRGAVLKAMGGADPDWARLAQVIAEHFERFGGDRTQGVDP